MLKNHLRVSPNVFLIHTHDDSGSRGVTDELALLIITKKGPYLFTTNSHTDFFLPKQAFHYQILKLEESVDKGEFRDLIKRASFDNGENIL